MELFQQLSLQISPIYVLILLGILANRVLKVPKLPISILLIYLVTPFVVFRGALTVPFTLSNLSIPLLWTSVAYIISLLSFQFSKWIWGEKSAVKNIMGLMNGASNTGYFGLPVALIVLGDQAFGYCVLIIMGNILFEYSLGYYLLARGRHSHRESLRKLLRVPNIYAFALGLVCNYCGMEISPEVEVFFGYFKSCFTLFGMMLIGMGIASMPRFVFDVQFISFGLVFKFLVWPLFVFSFVHVDEHYFHWLNSPMVYDCLKIISLVPLPANAVAFSTELKLYPEKVAVAVLLSTLLALFFIPLALSWLF